MSEPTVTDVTDSILDSTKQAIGLTSDYDVFDADIIMYINGVFGTLNQLGIGPDDGFEIKGSDDAWDTFFESLPNNKAYNLVKTYMTLRVRLLFDPPPTSFAQDALKEQIKEHEWRLSTLRESTAWVDPNLPVILP